MSKQPVIELYNVYLKSNRGLQVFKDLDFVMGQGETVLITGPAGSGKSLLVELLIGRIFAQEGSVLLFGELLQKRLFGRNCRLLRRIGGVGGTFSLIPSLNVSENITFPLTLTGAKKGYRSERLFKMLTEFSLLKQATEQPDKLTRVENTLVQFARASVDDRPLLIFDEPAAGLDGATFKRIGEYLAKAAISGRSLLILSSAELDLDIPNMKKCRFEGGRLV